MSIICYSCESQVINILHVNTTCTCMYASHQIIWSNAISMILKKQRNILIFKKYYDILFHIKNPIITCTILLSEKFSSGTKNSKLQTILSQFRLWYRRQILTQDCGPRQKKKANYPFLGWLRIQGLKFQLMISGFNVYMYD